MPIGSSLSLKPSSTRSFVDKAAQLISNIQSKLERRNAVRYKVAVVLDHRFEAILLVEFTYCSICGDFIVGLVAQRCKICKLTLHKKCLEELGNKSEHLKCIGADQSLDRKEIHKFEPDFFLMPTFCDHCGILIKGLISKQGVVCNINKGGCGITLHHDCKQMVCQSCQPRERKSWFKKQGNELNDSRSKEEEEKYEEQRWSRISIKDFDLIRLLGTGSFSKVYLAKLRNNREEFAIKVIKKTNLVVNSDPESSLTEKRVLSFGRQYPFLTIAHCCFQSRDRLYFVMEHVVGRDLVYHIRKARKFSEERTKFHSAEIVLALRFLHKQGVIYRDLKLDNVILDKHGHCKLLDFGMSKELCKTVNLKTRTFCGTPNYISPEIIKELDYSFSVDWWSLGVLMFEMLVGYSPFEAQDEDQLYRLIVEEDIKFPMFLSDRARNVLEGLLTKNPQTRLGCDIRDDCEQAILDHPFFQFHNGYGQASHRWEDIEFKRITPPYKPASDDLEQHDESKSKLFLTPIHSGELKKVAQLPFDGFSYYSESFESLIN